MNVRPAETRDAPAIAALWNAMIRDTLATFTTEEKLYIEIEDMIARRSESFWVAEDENGVGGFVTYGPFRGGPGYAATVEHTVILAPAAQGRGVGRALMERAMKAAQAQEIHVMVAGISGANPSAVAFHRALGFTQTARMPELGRKHGVWLDLILMQKNLSAA